MTANPEIIRMYGADWCRDCIRTKRQLNELGISFEYINLEDVPDAAEEARSISGRTNIPVVVYPDGDHQVEPTNAEVEQKLRGLNLLSS